MTLNGLTSIFRYFENTGISQFGPDILFFFFFIHIGPHTGSGIDQYRYIPIGILNHGSSDGKVKNETVAHSFAFPSTRSSHVNLVTGFFF